jgi:hypothetical protein
MVWYSPLYNKCSVIITLGKGLHYKFKVVFESSFNVVWLHVLWIVSYDITISFSGATSQSKLSKGGVFFFFHFCSKIFLTYKASVEEGRLCLILSNAFVFVQNSKMFPHFARYTPFVTFCNGEYNFKVREFLSKFFIFLAPFLLVFINYISEFFSHLQ